MKSSFWAPEPNKFVPSQVQIPGYNGEMRYIIDGQRPCLLDHQLDDMLVDNINMITTRENDPQFLIAGHMPMVVKCTSLLTGMGWHSNIWVWDVQAARLRKLFT